MLLKIILSYREKGIENDLFWDFPDGPVVKTSPSKAGGAGLIPGQGSKIPHASRLKNQEVKEKQIATNSIKTLTMVHIQKTKQKEPLF